MNYPMLDTFLSIMWFFLWILWIFLLVRVTLDIFRDDRLHGWGKAGWLIFVLILPYIGVLVYLIARGHGMGERDYAQAKQQRAAMDDYIRSTAASGGGSGGGSGGLSPAEQLSRIADLKNSGALTEQEYQTAKAKILA
ncbi:PLDc N-terminal domain-containing protein [Actinospica durhamensis]|uniref:PLDc N-terminal domain-containing protein n=1 Tax=Actinospica durhamensis TaxID=1508375 RepID=A0A941EWJ3_9ACTN|nr:PLDc N-terminal domain-containing protein [Actinospica durhamensis]MBR7838266.1 PLDc N-terminal domain-containing protein [Actinospica durhamensis]